jgi:hypothetical protein
VQYVEIVQATQITTEHGSPSEARPYPTSNSGKPANADHLPSTVRSRK